MRRSSFLKTALSLVFAGKVLDTVAEAATPPVDPSIAKYPLMPGECYIPRTDISLELESVAKYSILMTVHKVTGIERHWYVAHNEGRILDLKDVISGEGYIVSYDALLDQYHVAIMGYSNVAGKGYISKAR